MPWKSDKQRRWGHTATGIKALGGKKAVSEWDSASKNKLKPKLAVNNKMKGSFGRMDPKSNKIEVNIKAHKKNGKLDRAELASTIKHEMMHVKKPKATERQVYKATAKTKISPAEQNRLIAKLRMAKINQKVGSIKRKFKMKPDEKVEPGTFINKAKAARLALKDRVGIMGLV